MGIQGFFSYLQKYQKNGITNIKMKDKYEKITENVDGNVISKLSFKSYLKDKLNIEKFDNILIDFQSIIYSVLNKYTEIDLLIFNLDKLINMIEKLNQIDKTNFLKNNPNLIKNINYTINKFPTFFKTININTDINTDITKEILIKFYNSIKDITSEQLQQILIHDVYDYTLKLIHYYLNIPTNVVLDIAKKSVKIYFDGIPSMSKIKEQLSRRVVKQIEGYITNNLKNIIFREQPNITNDFISNKSIPIGHNTQIVTELRQKFLDFGFKCNTIIDTLDEAEHQIMKDISNNQDSLKDKNIVILSPDADLIILGLIQNTKYNLNIYIHKLETINIEHSKFKGKTYIDEYYINIKELRNSQIFQFFDIKLQNQQLLDLCYILLLIGDDFLPQIPTLNINAFPDIKKALMDIIKINPNFKIVEQCCDDYILNHYNFMRYIKELQKFEEKIYNKIKIKTFDLDFIDNNGNGISDFQKYFMHYIPYYYDDHYYKTVKEKLIEKYLYFKKAYDNGIFLKKKFEYNKYNLLKNKNTFDEIKNNFDEIKKKTTNECIYNYIEGCQFIFDLYFNNKINNYRWYYKYNYSPILENILEYYKKNKNKNFSEKFYIKKKEQQYLQTSESYQRYSELNKNNILKDIINNIIKESKENILTEIPDELINYQYELDEYGYGLIKNIVDYMPSFGGKTYKQETPITEITPDILQKYLIYSNIPFIYDCFIKKYFNKCINYNTELSDLTTFLSSSVLIQKGGYKDKYLKYKAKYINLKNIITY